MVNPTGIGASILRKEDQRFITGRGNYVADLKRPGLTAGVFVRSPHAHAVVRAIDASAALTIPGVVAVLTGADLLADGVGGIPCGWGIKGKDGMPMKEPAHPAMAQGKVRYVGDAIAFVVAETVELARQGAEAVAIDYDVLPAVVGVLDAVRPDAPLLFDDVPRNLCCDWEMGDRAAVDAAFAEAAHVARISLVNNRLVGNPMEPRAAVAEYEASTDRTTLWTTSQFPHVVRLLMGNFVLKIPQHKLRVVAPDVGGGFGVKQFHYAEEAVLTWAARRLHRPIKWVCDRSEGFISDAHGRDHVSEAEMALDETGKFLALRVSTLANMGGYLSTFGPNIPTNLYAPLLGGVYTTPAIYCEVKCVFTNTVPVDAYRGAGRPEASYLIERAVDAAARELGLAPDALRRKNLIKPKALPYKTPTGKVYDSGDFAGGMARAQELADWAGFNKRLAASKRGGKLRGIGMATYVEACGNNGPETATINLDKDGGVTVLIGSQSTGQGHATSYAQLVADHLDLPPELVRVVQGDTDRIATGAGTGGSSSIPIGGVSVDRASRTLATQLKEIAADALEASAGDLEIADGSVRIAGTDRAISFADIAAHLKATPEKLKAENEFGNEPATYPNGTHIAEVEIDPATGVTTITKYVIVDDFGKTLNPLMLAGQVHGGAVQGIGQALMEDTVYDPQSGQLVSASFMDYPMPHASDAPDFVFETRNTPCKTNPLGVKGAGEAGAIGSCPALINAIVDALYRGHGIRHIDMPATPQKVWQAIETARKSRAA